MSVTRSNGEEAGGPVPGKGSGRLPYSFFSSLRIAIFLLSFIAVTSIFGTIIRQRAEPEEYLSLYSQGTYRVIKLLGLDDAYHAWWFYTAIALFTINLVLCTTNRVRSFKRSAKVSSMPEENKLSALEQNFLAEGKDSKFVLERFGRLYKRAYDGEDGTILEKGSFSKYGVFIIHASIIIILAGSLIGLVLGYRGSIILMKGETKDFITMRGRQVKEIPLGFAVKCKDFRVSFYPGGEPKDYVSTVSIIDHGAEVMERQIRVNDPLSYKGMRIYQATYGKVPSFSFNIGGENVTLREGDTYSKNNFLLMVAKYEATVHDFGPGVLIAYLDKGEPKTAWFLRDVERLRQRNIGGVDIRFEGIQEEFYTGLEAARDPGIWVVWTGFAMILFGLYVNFFSYFRRFYIKNVASGTLVAGFAYRNKDSFRSEFEKIERKVKGHES